MLIILGIFMVIFCTIFGFLKIFKEISKKEFGIFNGIKIMLFGWMFLTWLCWIQGIQTGEKINILIPIIFTAFLIIAIIGQKVLKGHLFKKHILKRYSEEKSGKWES